MRPVLPMSIKTSKHSCSHNGTGKEGLRGVQVELGGRGAGFFGQPGRAKRIPGPNGIGHRPKSKGFLNQRKPLVTIGKQN